MKGSRVRPEKCGSVPLENEKKKIRGENRIKKIPFKMGSILGIGILPW